MSTNLIGPLLKEIRESKGLTQKQIAKKGIVSQPMLSKIERGIFMPGAHIFSYLAQCYDLSMDLFRHAMELKHGHYQLSTIYHVEDAERFIRQAIRKQDYIQVRELLKEIENSPLFKTPLQTQFILWHKGIIEQELHKDSEKSLAFLSKAKDKVPNQHNSLRQAEIANSEGIVYLSLQDWSRASMTFDDAIQTSQSFHQFRNYEIHIRLHYNLAITLHQLGQLQQSAYICKKAIQSCFSLESLYLLGELHYQYGLNHYHLGSLDDAKEYISDAIVYFRKANQSAHLAYVINKQREYRLI